MKSGVHCPYLCLLCVEEGDDEEWGPYLCLLGVEEGDDEEGVVEGEGVVEPDEPVGHEGEPREERDPKEPLQRDVHPVRDHHDEDREGLVVRGKGQI